MRPLHHDRLVKLVLQIVQAAAIRGHSRGNTKVFNKCLKADANNENSENVHSVRSLTKKALPLRVQPSHRGGCRGHSKISSNFICLTRVAGHLRSAMPDGLNRSCRVS